MSSHYAKRQLYGGGIVVALPSNSIDASDLRQIPDHQEVFLRENTPTSIIFEINEYQSSTTVASAEESAGHTVATNLPMGSSNVTPAEEAVATYHMKDVIAQTDYLSPESIETVSVEMSQHSVAHYPAYRSAATFITPEMDQSAKSTLPIGWQSNPVQNEYQTKTQQLLVRLKEYDTDLCVRINVPMKEFKTAQSEAALTELAVADQIMKNIIESLDVKDFGLFGVTE